jgi:hypothetical protein
MVTFDEVTSGFIQPGNHPEMPAFPGGQRRSENQYNGFHIAAQPSYTNQQGSHLHTATHPL